MSEAVSVGLPSYKRKFDLMNREGVNGDCLLKGSLLYTLYNDFTDENKTLSSIKVIDLDSFNGDEESVEALYSCENKHVFDVVSAGEGSFLLAGDRNIIVSSVDEGIQTVSEFDMALPTGWKISYSAFVIGNLYYRQLDDENPALGIDVFDLDARSVISHLDLDLVNPSYIGSGLIVGKRENGNFAIYSMKEHTFLSEFCSKTYFNCPSESKLDFHFSLFENNLAIARNDSVLVVELNGFSVAHNIQPFADEKFKSRLAYHSGEISDFVIAGISFAGKCVVIHGGFFSFLMCIDLDAESMVQWVYDEGGELQSNYVGGGLIYGLEASRPVAWDVCSGECVWRASAGAVANKIQIGDGWVVYSQSSGYVQCFRWDNVYKSSLV